MWPFDAARKRREAAAAEEKRRQEHQAAMLRIQRDLDRAERSRLIAAQNASSYKASVQRQAAYASPASKTQTSASDDYLNPFNPLSPLNPIYNYEAPTPTHSSSHCSDNSHSSYSSDHSSSYSHSSHDHSCSSSSYDSSSSDSSSSSSSSYD